MPGKALFGRYVDKYVKEKIRAQKTGNSALKAIAKLGLNAPTGKPGQKHERETRDYDNDG